MNLLGILSGPAGPTWEPLARWVGTALALIAAFGSSRDATKRFRDDLRNSIRATIRGLAGRIRRPALRLWRWINRIPPVVHQMEGTISGKVTMSGVGEARMFPEWKWYHSYSRRIGMLDIRTRDLDRRLGNLSQELREAQQQLREEFVQRHDLLGIERRKLDARMAHLQESSVAADARALPLVAIGVIMTSLSPDVPGWPLWFVLILAGFAVYALIRIWRSDLPEASRPTP